MLLFMLLMMSLQCARRCIIRRLLFGLWCCDATELPGKTDENERYAQRVAEMGVAAFKGCTPLKLPAQYYQTPGGGGWNSINYRWQLK